MKRVVIGGTFDRLHKGHRKLLEIAFAVGDEAVIGLTSDNLVKTLGKSVGVAPFEERRKALMDYLKARNWLERCEIVEIDNVYGTAPERDDLDMIIATEDTKQRVAEINRIRRSKHLRELRMILVEKVLSQDGKPISSSRIRAEEVDTEGRMLKTKV